MIMSSSVEAELSECTVWVVVLAATDNEDVTAGRRTEVNRLRRTEVKLEAFVLRGSVSYVLDGLRDAMLEVLLT